MEAAMTTPATPGKLDIIIKINTLPAQVETDKNGWKSFGIDCDGVHVRVSMRPKMWTKLAEAAANWPQWVGSISGKLGPIQGQGLTLLEPSVQVFERKAKEAPNTPSSSA